MRVEQPILNTTLNKNGVIYSEECLKSLQGKDLGLPVTVNFDKDRIVGVLAEAYYKDGKLYGVMHLDKASLLRNGVDFGRSVYRPAGLTPHHVIKDSEGNRIIDRLRMVTIGMIPLGMDAFTPNPTKKRGKLSIWNHIKILLNKFGKIKEPKWRFRSKSRST